MFSIINYNFYIFLNSDRIGYIVCCYLFVLYLYFIQYIVYCVAHFAMNAAKCVGNIICSKHLQSSFILCIRCCSPFFMFFFVFFYTLIERIRKCRFIRILRKNEWKKNRLKSSILISRCDLIALLLCFKHYKYIVSSLRTF